MLFSLFASVFCNTIILLGPTETYEVSFETVKGEKLRFNYASKDSGKVPTRYPKITTKIVDKNGQQSFSFPSNNKLDTFISFDDDETYTIVFKNDEDYPIVVYYRLQTQMEVDDASRVNYSQSIRQLNSDLYSFNYDVSRSLNKNEQMIHEARRIRIYYYVNALFLVFTGVGAQILSRIHYTKMFDNRNI